MLQHDPNRFWYLHRNGQQHGPMTDAEFQRLVGGNLLQPTDFVWFEGLANWTSVSEFSWAVGSPRPDAGRQTVKPDAAAQDAAGRAAFSWPANAGGNGQPNGSTAASAAAAVGTAQRGRGAIFVSYRRNADSWAARSMFENLVPVMGDARIFMDIEGIDPGENFRDVLRERLYGCSAFVPLIGPSWLEAKARNGHHIAIRRPHDIVRLEIELALEVNRSRPGFVVPLLVDDAQMPDADDLPASIAALSNCQAMRLTHASFRDVMADLRNLAEQRAREAQLDQTRTTRVAAPRPQPQAGSMLGGPLEFPKIVSR